MADEKKEKSTKKRRDLFSSPLDALEGSPLAYFVPPDHSNPKIFTDEEKRKWAQGGNLVNPFYVAAETFANPYAEAAQSVALKHGKNLAVMNSPVFEELFRRLFYRSYMEHQKDPNSGWTWRKGLAAFQDTPGAIFDVPASVFRGVAGAVAHYTAEEDRKWAKLNADEAQKKSAYHAEQLKNTNLSPEMREWHKRKVQDYDRQELHWRQKETDLEQANEGDNLFSTKTGEIARLLYHSADEVTRDWTLPARAATWATAAGGNPLGALAVAAADVGLGVLGRKLDLDETRDKPIKAAELAKDYALTAGLGVLGSKLLPAKAVGDDGKYVNLAEKNRQIRNANQKAKVDYRIAKEDYERELKRVGKENTRLESEWNDAVRGIDARNQSRFDNFVEELEQYRGDKKLADDLYEATKQERTARAEAELAEKKRLAEEAQARNDQTKAEFDQQQAAYEDYVSQKTDLDRRVRDYLGEPEEGLDDFQTAANTLRDVLAKDMKYLPEIEPEVTPAVNANWYRTWAAANPHEPEVIGMANLEKAFQRTRALLAQKDAKLKKLIADNQVAVEGRHKVLSSAQREIKSAWDGGKTLEQWKAGEAELEELSMSELAKLAKMQFKQLSPYGKVPTEDIKELIKEKHPLFAEDFAAHNSPSSSTEILLPSAEQGGFEGLTKAERSLLELQGDRSPTNLWWDVQNTIRKGRVGHEKNYSFWGMPKSKEALQATAEQYGGKSLMEDVTNQVARERGYGESRHMWRDATGNLLSVDDKLAELLLKDKSAYYNLARLEGYAPEAFGGLKQSMDRFMVADALARGKNLDPTNLPLWMTRRMDQTHPPVPFNKMTEATRSEWNPYHMNADMRYDFDRARYDVDAFSGGDPTRSNLAHSKMGPDVEGYNLMRDAEALRAGNVQPPKPPKFESVPAIDEEGYWSDFARSLGRDRAELEKQVVKPSHKEFTSSLEEYPKPPKEVKPELKEPKKPVEKPLLTGRERNGQVRGRNEDSMKPYLYYGQAMPIAREAGMEADPFGDTSYEALFPGNSVKPDATAVAKDGYESPLLPGKKMTKEDYEGFMREFGVKKQPERREGLVFNKTIGQWVTPEDNEALNNLR